jgi:hypothetical protein
MAPNSHGGQTAMYSFHLDGREALSWGYIKRFKDLVVQVGGKIFGDRTRDLEA